MHTYPYGMTPEQQRALLQDNITRTFDHLVAEVRLSALHNETDRLNTAAEGLRVLVISMIWYQNRLVGDVTTSGSAAAT